MDVVIGIDSSTTSTKAVAFSAHGVVVAESRREIDRHSPRPTWHEQNAKEWWRATSEALAQVASALQTEGHKPVGLGIAHQRESFVLLDEDFEPVRPAILWLDARAGEQVKRLGTRRVHALSGKPPSTTPSIYKLAWLVENEPESLKRTRFVAEVHGYLSQHLTGRFATSVASADPTALVDMVQRDWSEELTSSVGLNRSMLAEIVEPGSLIGGITSSAAAATGLPRDLPVFAGAGDGQSGGLGSGVAEPGLAYLSLGTSIVVGAPACRGTAPSLGYRVVGSPVDKGEILEAYVATGALSISWFRTAFRSPITDDDACFDEAVSQVAPGSGGLRFLPYLSGSGTPYWDGRSRGAFLGIDESQNEATFLRAVLEGLAFEIELLVDGLEKGAGPIEKLVVMGGGAASRTWLQIIADIVHRPIVISSNAESAALGAAMLAASGSELIRGGVQNAANQMTENKTVIVPDAYRSEFYAGLRQGYRSIYPALKPLFESGAVGQ